MNTEREKDLLKLLYDRYEMTVKEMAETLFASEPSIRRDLAHLEKQRLIKRFHGGARVELASASPIKLPYLVREMTDTEEKKRLARRAAEYVHDQHLIFLDSSTTALAMLPFLAGRKDLTIVSDGVKILHDATDYGIRVISTGGVLQRSNYSLFGEDTFTSIRQYYANTCFISCGALDVEGNASDLSQEENMVRRAMMAQSNRTVLLCTAARIGKRTVHHLCTVSELEAIVCTRELPNSCREKQVLAE